MLDLADIGPYLIERGLLSEKAVVYGGLHIVDESRLNRVFVVSAEGSPGFVLKFADEPGRNGVAREAAVLERLRSLDNTRLTSSLPAVVAFDATDGVLILEAAPNARDLARHHAGGQFSRALAGQAGRALALLHAMPPAALDGLPGRVNTNASLGVHEPDLESIRMMSTAAIELTRVIQGLDDLCGALDELRVGWCESSVIHGDIRWDNLLAVRGGDPKRWTRLHLIDWELCGPGDPAVDIGAFFGEYLRAWLQSIPIADPKDPGRLLAHAGLPLRRMRPALAAFWDAYTLHRRAPAAELSGMLRRATRFAAVRLVTAALEEAETLAELRASVLYLLPLSQNILRRPDEAAAHLLGLGASRASP